MLEDLTPPVKVRRCKVGRILDSLDDKDQAILQKALDNHHVWPVKTLSRELTARGLSVTEGPISLHRSSSCGCYKS